jgi:streptogramin lyase
MSAFPFDLLRVAWRGRRVPYLIGMAVTALALSGFVAPYATAHAGHDHDASMSYDGRLPGQPDFERVGNTTYRFNPDLKEYEIKRPGKATTYAHGDPSPIATGVPSQTVTAGPAVDLPTSELAPVCRSSGNRIVPVFTHRPSDGTPTPVATIQSILKRMNWKVNDQSSQSSGGSRALKMIVDCTGGTINVHNVATANNSMSTVEAAVQSALFGSPGYGDAVKYLVFDNETLGTLGGIATGYKDSSKDSENAIAIQSGVALVYSGRWTNHVPLHELFHTLGAVQGAVTPAAPYSTYGSHCTDGFDALCYNDGSSGSASYSEERCPSSLGYDTPNKVPLDCGTDTYFDALPEAESWLDKYWNVAGLENPFLAGPPKATSGGLEFLDTTAAQLWGEVDPGGYDTSYYVQYGPTTSYGSTAPIPSATLGAGAPGEKVWVWLEELSPNTTYHYRFVASNTAGTSYGADQQLKTPPGPSVVTGGISGKTSTEATLDGSVNPNGYATEYYFEYGTTIKYDQSVPVPWKGIGSGTGYVFVSEKLTGLKPTTLYHYRLIAVNDYGFVAGKDKTFTTHTPPVAITEPASGETGTGATLRGKINPNGLGTGYQFEYGPTTAYGTAVPIPVGYGSAGTSLVEVSKAITGLVEGTTYHYRIKAYSEGGTTYGEDRTFKALKLAEYTLPSGGRAIEITKGPDGNLWFTAELPARIGKVTPAGEVTEYPLSVGSPWGITAGPDGNLWFTNRSNKKIGKITTSGTITEYPVINTSPGLLFITAGPDGNLWFTENSANKIGKITTSGAVVEYSLPTYRWPEGITAGTDGNLWYVTDTEHVGKMNTSGSILGEYSVMASASPRDIAAGPDGKLWFTMIGQKYVGKVTTSGTVSSHSASNFTTSITAGPDGNMWFTMFHGNKLARITTSGTVTEYAVGANPAGLTVGPDGKLWFTTYSGKVGKLTP